MATGKILNEGDELLAFAFMLGMMMAIVLFFRLIAPRLMSWFAPQLDAEKRGKCSVYMTELIFSSVALLFVVGCGGWNPAWVFDFASEEGSIAYSLTLGNLAAAWTCAAMYVVELSGEPHMRISLLAHHFAFCSRVLAAVLEISIMPELYAKAGARMVSCWLWLPTTEQNVFLIMLLYRIYPNLPAKHLKLSSLLYMATRLFGIVLSLCAFVFYIFAGLGVLEERPGYEVIFVLCVLVQTLGFAVMIWAQYSSARSQWGLAQKQCSKLQRLQSDSDRSSEICV
eukprot:TRINITY_DN60849_c0_g1_i1.p1 TRINITY_DN60849_c0_g1~~TRINITY_DN60849_c0_g1_i1.p1  ORF type:complete len:283 (-),score=45.50 TRINITY_DN60849_c0_g1_i1:167-1015(-)